MAFSSHAAFAPFSLFLPEPRDLFCIDSSSICLFVLGNYFLLIYLLVQTIQVEFFISGIFQFLNFYLIDVIESRFLQNC